MSDVLDPPSTILFAGVSTDYVAERRASLLDGHATTVRSVDDAASARTAVCDDDGIACVVVGSRLPDATRPDLCSTIRSSDPDLPVFVLANDDVDLIRSVIRNGATDVLDPEASGDTLRSVVDDGIRLYQRRRVNAEESNVLTSIFEEMGKSIYVKDDEARIVHISDVPGGFDPTEARGKTDVELYGDDDPVAAKESYEDDCKVIEEGAKVVDRDEHVDADGEDLWMRTTKVPWTDGAGNVQGLVGLTIDVTEFKHTERRLEELGREFEMFTSRLGHDVNTPLQVASGYLDIAEETGDADAFSKVEQSLERIEEIVDDYRALNERAAQRENPGPVDLEAIVEDVWSALDTGDTTLVADVDADARINATEQMVRPVLENLLKNAVTHGGEDLQVRVGLTDDGFYVEDTGKGIPESKREKVIEPGYTTHCDGSGRGLSIVTDEMARHVWSLSIDEALEGGARFEIGNCRAAVHEQPDGPTVPLDQEGAVGTLEQPGESEYDPAYDRWTVTGDGVDVFRAHNDFYYVYGTVEGDVSIRGRIAHVDDVDDYSKGGFMVRDALDSDGTYGYVGKTPTHGSELLWRDQPGTDGHSEQLNEQAFTFDWYRLERRGDEVTMYLSLDGEHWQEIGRRTVSLSDPVHVGLVTCSCRPGQQATTVFEDVTVTTLSER